MSGVGRVVAMTTALLREALSGKGVAAGQLCDARVSPAPAPIPMAVPGAGGSAFGDRFEKRAAGHEFYGQCDKMVSPDRVKRCQSNWCKLRDLAA